MKNFATLTKGEMYEFEATVDKYGWSGPVYKRTKNLCLKNILLDGKLFESHMWTSELHPFIEINARRGDNVKFYASPDVYYKGYEGWANKGRLPKEKKADYHLTNFNGVRKIPKKK